MYQYKLQSITKKSHKLKILKCKKNSKSASFPPNYQILYLAFLQFDTDTQ